LAPAFLIVSAVVVYPVIMLVRLSVCDIAIRGNNLVYDFVGIKNFIKVIENPDFIVILKNTFYFSFFSIFLGFILAFIITLSLDRVRHGVTVLRIFILLPWIVPMVVSAMMWSWVLNDVAGIFNFILLDMNVIDKSISWTGTLEWAMKTVIWSDIWVYTPFCVMILHAGLQQIPEEMYQSAKVDGAGPVATFFYITLPSLKRYILFILLIRTIFAMRTFDLIFVLTQGGPGDATNILGIEVYFQGVRFLNLHNAGVLSMIILIITVIICLVIIRLIRVEE
jgi:multiple sugar transport system permease protein